MARWSASAARNAAGVHPGQPAPERGRDLRACPILQVARARPRTVPGRQCGSSWTCAGALYGLGLALGKLGHWEEAEAAFAKALRVRPDFAEARGALDLVRRGRAKREDAAPVPAEREAASPGCWQLRAATGVQYDSNVRLEPHTAGAGDRDDAAFLFVAGGHFDLLRSERLLLRLDYDFYQTLHPDLDDFDFRSHRVA